ncbi:MAG TPA: hypothetical protein VHI78_08655, partial [Bacteroidales bacterium]|nr:hypothetical protein [Bacteroidales bacterium]
MIKTTTTILGFLLLCVHSFCDAPDTSIFTSDFEKKIFLKLDNREPVDSIDLFTALNFKALSANEKVIGYFEKIYEKVRNLPMNKKLKTVYQEVHNEFFSKYTEEAFFNDIFINGNYNCVTATALYALFFDKLGIDYQIKETPDHVYLIADPKNTAMLIESTLPGEKIVQYDERLKIQYVEFLYNNKLISESEFRNISISELFEKHYLNDKTISLKQLAAIQYYNKGIFEYQKKNYGDALKDFEKAKLLNADEMISYMLNNTLINLLELENQLKSYSGRILAKYIAVNDSNTLGLEIAKDY